MRSGFQRQNIEAAVDDSGHTADGLMVPGQLVSESLEQHLEKVELGVSMFDGDAIRGQNVSDSDISIEERVRAIARNTPQIF